MAQNQFLTFAGDPAANVMGYTAYADPGFTARILGFSTGTAISQQLNQTWRQSSLITAMLAQFTCDQTGLDMIDDGTPGGMANLENNFTSAIKTVALGTVGTGYLKLTGGTLSGPLSINCAATQLALNAPAGQYVNFVMNCPAGQARQILGFTNNSLRWNLLLGDTNAETGGNNGSGLAIARYSDAGAYLDEPLYIYRSTGVVNFSHMPTLNGAVLPFLSTAGGTLTGALNVGGTGISYPGISGVATWAGHHIAFGWDGSFVQAAVDGTYVGELASVSWVQSTVGAYLPLAGGTVTGSVVVDGNFTTYGGAQFNNAAFGGASDFVNYYFTSGGVGYRTRQWAGGWWDGWRVTDGMRIWANYAGTWIMSCDGSGNMSLNGNLVAAGGGFRSTVWFGNLTDFSIFTSAGNRFFQWAGGGWYDWWRGTDGLRVWAAPNVTLMTLDGAGNLWANASITAAVNLYCASFAASANAYAVNFTASSNVNAGGSVAASGNVTAVGEVTAGNGGVVLGSNYIQFPGISANSYNFNWDGSRMYYRVNNANQREMIWGDGAGNVTQVNMYTNNLSWYQGVGGTRWFISAYTSDAKFKQNIRNAEPFDSLSAICNTRLTEYDWNLPDSDRHVPFGFTADDLKQTLPDTVQAMPAGEDATEATDYLDLPAMLAHCFRAIQQLEARL